MSKATLKTKVSETFLTGGKRTVASACRTLLGNIIDETANVIDGGDVFVVAVGYSTAIPTANLSDTSFVYKKWVVDYVDSVGGSISGLTANRLVRSTGPSTLVSSVVIETSTQIKIPSPTSATTYVEVVSTNVNLTAAGGLLIASSEITNNRALAVNSSGHMVSSDSSLANLNFISTLSSDVQVQLNAIVNTTLTGSMTAGYLPVATGTRTVGNSRARQSVSQFYIESPDGFSSTSVSNNSIYSYVAVGSYGSRAYLDNTRSGIQFTTVSTNAFVEVQSSVTTVSNSSLIVLDAPTIRLSQLTANRVVYLDVNKEFRSSTITPTELGFSAGLTSNIQAQFTALTTYVDNAVAGLFDLRGFYTPSGSNYPSTGGSGSAGAVKKGDVYIMNGISGTAVIGATTVSNGDMVVALVDTPGNTDTNWGIVENNLQYTPLNASLTSGYLYIGNGSNIGTARQISGAIVIDNTGVSTYNTVVPQAKGGTGTATIPDPGAIPYQGSAGAYLYDVSNYSYDPGSKTLNINNINITPTTGINGIYMETDSLGIDIKGLLSNSYLINLTGANGGIQADTVAGVAGRFTSSEYAGEFNQFGNITGTVLANALSVNRNYGGAGTASGSVFRIHDSMSATLGTGYLIEALKTNVRAFAVTKEGYIGIGDVTIDDAIVLEGSVDRVIKMGYNPTAASPGKALYYKAGNAAVGSTNQAGGNLYHYTGTSRGTGVANQYFYATPAGSSGTGENAPIAMAVIKGDGRTGIGGRILPAAYFEMAVPNGQYGFNILNKELTASVTTDVGWGIRPATNGSTSTNLLFYELVGATFQNREILHKGGNRSIGYSGTDSFARLLVAGSSANTTIGVPVPEQQISLLANNTTSNNYTAYTFYTLNASSAEVLTGGIYGVYTDRTAGSEDMDIVFATRENGSYAERARITGDTFSILRNTTVPTRIGYSGGLYNNRSGSSSASNSAASAETVLYTNTLQAALLDDGDCVEFEYGYAIVGNAFTKEIKISFQGNVIFTTGALTNATDGFVVIRGTIQRNYATGIRYNITMIGTNMSTNFQAKAFIQAVSTLASNDAVLSTSADTPGAVNNQVAGYLANVKYLYSPTIN
jgi:hypothetical protein